MQEDQENSRYSLPSQTFVYLMIMASDIEIPALSLTGPDLETLEKNPPIPSDALD
jgi:hypothetical protein